MEKKGSKFIKKSLIAFFCFILFTVSGCSFFGRESKGERLAIAIQNGNYQAVKECLKDKTLDLEHLGVSENTNFKNGDQRALAFALESSSESRVAITRLLLDAGADAASKSDHQSYLQVVEQMDTDLFSRFLKKGANLNETADGYRLVDRVAEKLMIGDEKQEIQRINDLVSKGAKVDSKTLKCLLGGEWRYSYAKEILMQIKKEKRTTGISQALEAAISGQDQIVQTYIEKKDIPEKEKTDFICFAAANCKRGTLEQLRRQGYSFQVKDAQGRTPLHIAAFYNSADVVQYFLDQKISGQPIYGKSDDWEEENYSALDLAILSGDYEKYKLCKKSGISCAEDKNLWNMAARLGSKRTIELLERIGNEPSAADLTEIYTKGNDTVLKYLIKKQYIPITITEEMAEETSHDIIEMLYKTKVNVSQTALCRMIEAQENSMVKKILREKRYQGELEKEVLLYYAVNAGNLEMVKYMVNIGADINRWTAEGEGGQSAIHEAAGNLSLDIFKYLKENGGKLDKKDVEGKTAKEIAKENTYFKD